MRRSYKRMMMGLATAGLMGALYQTACAGFAGDQVLRTVAAQITDCLRPYDQAFRFGGEEFVVMLSQTAQVKGMEIAERIRQRIATHRKPDGGSAPTITVSIGCGEFRHDETIGELFDRADRALYAAKNQGRNRVVAAS